MEQIQTEAILKFFFNNILSAKVELREYIVMKNKSVLQFKYMKSITYIHIHIHNTMYNTTSHNTTSQRDYISYKQKRDYGNRLTTIIILHLN